MSFWDDTAFEDGIRNPLLHTGSCYRIGPRNSSMMGSSTGKFLRESIFNLSMRLHRRPQPYPVWLHLGYSNPTQLDIINGLGLSILEFSIFRSLVNVGAMVGAIASGQIAE